MRVNEIFYSIQGEGAMTGTPAVFVRFAGCNLKCPFCDTEHEPYREMTPQEIVREVCQYPASLVIITGGEPTMQLTDDLVRMFHEEQKLVAVETNGTSMKGLRWVDWITCSPKRMFVNAKAAIPVLTKADEVKVVFDGVQPVEAFGIAATHYYLQPCDTGDTAKNAEIIEKCINYIKENPKWRMSLQTQKILKVR